MAYVALLGLNEAQTVTFAEVFPPSAMSPEYAAQQLLSDCNRFPGRFGAPQALEEYSRRNYGELPIDPELIAHILSLRPSTQLRPTFTRPQLPWIAGRENINVGIKVVVSPYLTAPYYELRGALGDNDFEDFDFPGMSDHVQISLIIENQFGEPVELPIAVIRLTQDSGTGGPLHSALKERDVVPVEAGNIHAMRGATAACFQCAGYFSLGMHLSLWHAYRQGAARMLLAVDTNADHRQSLYNVGFQNVLGERELTFQLPGKPSFPVVLVQYEFDHRNISRLEETRSLLLSSPEAVNRLYDQSSSRVEAISRWLLQLNGF